MRLSDGGALDGRLAIGSEPGVERSAPGKHARSGAEPPSETDGPSPFARILHGLGTEVDRGEALVRRATAAGSGRELGTGDLLALQAGVYRYSEAVDLAAKLVDRATSGVKTVIQGQGS